MTTHIYFMTEHASRARRYVLALLIATLASCRVPLEEAECPCADGWTCCATTDRCVQDLAACPPADGDEPTRVDAPPETSPGPPEAPCTTFSRLLDTCGLPLDSDLELDARTEYTYNTDTGTLLRDGVEIAIKRRRLATKDAEVDAILVHNLVVLVDTKLRAEGSRPMAIVASGDITVYGHSSIDVSAGGAGARASCSPPAGTGTLTPAGGGDGGGGGGFGGGGGRGGTGDSLNPGSSDNHGAPPVETPAGPRGGCRGGDGFGVFSRAGIGGRGGGAIYLLAGGTILLDDHAVLAANGEGGSGGGCCGVGDLWGWSGGGGGGSGGMILLEAPVILGAQSITAANGGGGGEGSDLGATTPGQPGQTGLLSTEPAAGGAGGAVNATAGGRGGSRDAVNGEAVVARPIDNNGGGGGGGGGAGYILVASPASQLGSTSPAPIKL